MDVAQFFMCGKCKQQIHGHLAGLVVLALPLLPEEPPGAPTAHSHDGKLKKVQNSIELIQDILGK